ncbi:MAG: PAS domain S-box protein [Deltaproteobacteria bacterium]|nr:PAS domain S-box protein [Deltaproteobacteria bacterium]
MKKRKPVGGTPPATIGFRQVFEKKPNGSAVFKVLRDRRRAPVDGVFLTVNQAFEAITGRARAAVVGKKASEVFPGWKPAWREVFERAAGTNEPVHTEGHDASIGRYLKVTAYSTRRDRCAVTVADVTDERWAEEAVRADRKRLKFILENTRDIVYAARSDGTITYVSPQISVLGLDPARVIGTSMFEYIHPDDLGPVKQVLEKAFTVGWTAPVNLRLVGPDGRVIPFEESGNVHRKDGVVTGITGVLRDVTEREQADAERDALARRLEEALSELKALRASVSVCARCGGELETEGQEDEGPGEK